MQSRKSRVCWAFSVGKCRAVSWPWFLCVKRSVLPINPSFKTIVSLWTQKSNLKCNDLFVLIVSDCPLGVMNALSHRWNYCWGDGSLTEKPPGALCPASNGSREKQLLQGSIAYRERGRAAGFLVSQAQVSTGRWGLAKLRLKPGPWSSVLGASAQDQCGLHSRGYQNKSPSVGLRLLFVKWTRLTKSVMGKLWFLEL